MVLITLLVASLTLSSSTDAVNEGEGLVMLPMTTGAACLDGSPYGFYLSLGDNGNSTRWVFSIQGGGWCSDENDCLGRSKGDLGSSKNWPKGPGGYWCGCVYLFDGFMGWDAMGYDEGTHYARAQAHIYTRSHMCMHPTHITSHHITQCATQAGAGTHKC